MSFDISEKYLNPNSNSPPPPPHPLAEIGLSAESFARMLVFIIQ